MTYDFEITDADIGRNLGVPDGYLVSLGMLTAPVYEVPTWDEGRMHWRTGYLELCGSRANRSLISWSPGQNGAAIGSPAIGVGDKIIPAMLVRDGSLDYAGDLTVLCVPRGGAFTITLSDTPYVRAPRPAIDIPAWWTPPGQTTAEASAAAPKPHGTARKAEAILEAARAP